MYVKCSIHSRQCCVAFTISNVNVLTCTFLDEKPTKVAFGNSGDRDIFPTHVPHTRFGTDLNPITGAPNRGPGHYKVEEVSISFCSVYDVYLVSFILNLLNFDVQFNLF